MTYRELGNDVKTEGGRNVSITFVPAALENVP